jgi:hypothetical protein
MNAEFVDSNVLVYPHDSTTPAKHDRTRALVERLWLEKTGRLRLQAMQECLPIVTRKIQPAGRERCQALSSGGAYLSKAKGCCIKVTTVTLAIRG